MKMTTQLVSLFCISGILLSGCFSRTCSSEATMEPTTVQPVISYKGEDVKAEHAVKPCACKVKKHHHKCRHHGSWKKKVPVKVKTTDQVKEDQNNNENSGQVQEQM